MHCLSLPARGSESQTANSSQCEYDLPAMPFAVVELDDRPACRARAQPFGAGPVVYKLPLQHSRLQREQCVPELHAVKGRSLTLADAPPGNLRAGHLPARSTSRAQVGDLI